MLSAAIKPVQAWSLRTRVCVYACDRNSNENKLTTNYQRAHDCSRFPLVGAEARCLSPQLAFGREVPFAETVRRKHLHGVLEVRLCLSPGAETASA